MRYQLFQYPLPAPPELPDLNAFLASERVAAVQHHVVATQGGAQIVFVVQVVGDRHAPGAKKVSKAIDYREVLTPEQFECYAKLRTERKAIAEAEGVPVYAVFTNAQLAEIVRQHMTKLDDLLTIEGVGAARVERFGERMLASLEPTE